MIELESENSRFDSEIASTYSPRVGLKLETQENSSYAGDAKLIRNRTLDFKSTYEDRADTQCSEISYVYKWDVRGGI